MKKYNILFLSHERKLGGASLSLVALAKELQQRGHRVYVVVLLKDCPLAKELRKNNIRTITLFFGWWMCPTYWNILLKMAFSTLYRLEWIAHKYLIHIVKKYEIDIVHSNSSVIDLGCKVARSTNTKHVWHFREFGLVGLSLDYMKGRQKSVEYINANTDGVIFISRVLRDYYSDINREEKVRVIHNGVSADYLQKKDFQDKDTVTFIVSGNLVENKNQMQVLEAARRLREEGYDKFAVHMAGTSTSLKESKDYEEELKKYIADHDLKKHVHMLGYVRDMNQVRREGDVEIVASSSEAFGRVSVEAMMSCMPVIGANSGANPEIIEHGRTGFLYKKDCVKELVMYMKRMMDNPEELKSMGEKAYYASKSRFTSERNAAAVEEFYHDLMRTIS